MSSYTQIIYQIVICTKHRSRVLTKPGREKLFKYIYGITQNKNCILFAINGVEDHLHIVLKLHPSVALADLIREIKTSSNKFIKTENLFMHFIGWSIGYAAFTYSIEALPNLIKYVDNQETHHQRKEFYTEYVSLLKEHGISYKEEYLFGD